MAAPRAIGVVEDPRYREHRGPEGHPERPERLRGVAAGLAPHRASLRPLAVRPASDEELLRVHTPAHLAAVAEAARVAPTQLDADTYLGPGSLEVARLAAGGAIELARAVARGTVPSGLAAIRPPGHHAEAAVAMGFCIFNNVAVAARALQAEEGVERVLVLDWDVHHGNGTQHRFESDPSVLYFSTHQYPYYPGTGAFGECGVGRGEGATLNVPLPAGTGDATVVGVFQRILVPWVAATRPDVILVSAGFDAHRDDPLASMRLTRDGYAALSAIVRSLADTWCGGRLAFVLEGGYALSGLEEGVGAAVEAAVAAGAPALPAPVEAPGGSLLAEVVARVDAVHGARVPDLGAA